MTPVRVSIIGLGLAVEPHVQSLLDLRDRVEVRWAASRSKDRIAHFASKYPFPVTTDIDRALTDPEVDAVILLTPPSSHLELGSRCLENGKHLLVEKPLELTVENGKKLIGVARRAGCRLGVVLQHRFRKSSLRAAELVASGALGTIEAATVAVPWWRPQSYYSEPGRGTLARDGGGVLITQAIHSIDLFRSLVGVSAVVAAHARTTSLHKMETEDLAMALVTLGNGAPGAILATTAAFPGKPEEINIFGSLGSLSIRGDAYEFQALDGRSESQVSDSGTSSGANPMGFSHHAHQLLISDFVDAIVSDRSPIVSGEEALATQILIDHILDASRRGGRTYSGGQIATGNASKIDIPTDQTRHARRDSGTE